MERIPSCIASIASVAGVSFSVKTGVAIVSWDIIGLTVSETEKL